MEGKRSPAAQSQREQGSKCAGKVISAPSRSLRSQRSQWGVGQGQGGGKIKLWGECIAEHPRDRQDGVGWPCSPLQAGDPHGPWPSALPVTDRGCSGTGRLQDTCGGTAPQRGRYQGRRDQVHVEILLIPFFCRIWRKFDSNFRTRLQREEAQGLCEPHLLTFEQKFKGGVGGVLREAEGPWVSQGKQKGLGVLLRAP